MENQEKSETQNRKRYRYAGVRPGKKTGTFLIDYYDWRGTRHQQTFFGSEADAAKVRRSILVRQDKIKTGLEAPPGAKANVLTLHQLWKAFEADRQLKISSGSMDAKSLERVFNTYRALLGYDTGLQAKHLDQFKAADFEGFKIYRKEIGRRPEGINTNLRGLKTVFNFAVRRGYISKSPLAEVPLVTVLRSDVRYLNDDELKILDYTILQH